MWKLGTACGSLERSGAAVLRVALIVVREHNRRRGEELHTSSIDHL
jgi:hypothetical protein